MKMKISEAAGSDQRLQQVLQYQHGMMGSSARYLTHGLSVVLPSQFYYNAFIITFHYSLKEYFCSRPAEAFPHF
jgi:hypothetical protein